MSITPIRGSRGEGIREVIDQAIAKIDECDGIVILMQKKKGGLLWFAPNSMEFQAIVFYLWSALTAFGMMGLKL